MAKKDKQPLLSGKRRKVIIIVAVVVLVLLAAGTGVALRWWQDVGQQTPGTSEANEEETPTLPPVVDDLQNLRNEGESKTFDQKITTALENPDYDDPTRALIYIQQGNAAYDSKDFNAALEAYLQAEELDPNSQTAQLVGFSYQELGDSAKAVEYYQLTIERFDPNNILYETDKAYFENRINQLQG